MTLDEVIKIAKPLIEVAIALGAGKGIHFLFKSYMKHRNSRWEEMKKGQTQILDTLATQGEQLTRQDQQIGEINYQLKPNSGHSLNDKVTGLIHSVQEVKVSQRLTREILDVASWESDAKGSIKHVSSALCDMLTCNADEFLDDSWFGLVCPKDRRRIHDLYKEAISNASTFNEDVIFRRCVDNWYQKTNVLVVHHKENGKVVGSLSRVTKIGEPTKEMP